MESWRLSQDVNRIFSSMDSTTIFPVTAGSVSVGHVLYVLYLYTVLYVTKLVGRIQNALWRGRPGFL